MRWHTVRGLGLASLALSGLLATTSCVNNSKYDDEASTNATRTAPAPAGTSSASPSASATPSIPATVLPTSFAPASSAGGVCAAITYAEIKAALGMQFQISAASGKSGDVQTCVLLPVAGDLPQLTFTATPLDADVTVDDYGTDLVPKGATDQDGLGRAAYSRVVAATGGAGPFDEVGWLGEETAYTLTLAFEPETGQPGATALIPQLIAVAPKLLG
jgi:hypothetical protein